MRRSTTRERAPSRSGRSRESAPRILQYQAQGIAVEQGAKTGNLHAQLKELEPKATLHPTEVSIDA